MLSFQTYRPGYTVRVEITEQTVASSKDVFVGEVHDLPENEAQYLIRAGKARATSEPQPPAPVEEAPPAEAAEEAPPPAPPKKGKK